MFYPSSGLLGALQQLLRSFWLSYGPTITISWNCSVNHLLLSSWQAALAKGLHGVVCFAGLKAEKEGLKASEKSDAAVRDAADKVIHKTSEAASKVDEKSGGFFGGLKHWLADR